MENKGCKTCEKQGYCEFPHKHMLGAGKYCHFYAGQGQEELVISKVRCCNNCKYYQPESVQPWEEGLISYMCHKHDKITQVDNYCECYEGKQ